MKIEIQAMELTLDPQELKNRITPEDWKKIQGKGKIQAYTLAHEGMSNPKEVGKKQTPLQWTKSVIRDLSKKIKNGTKFFVSHGEDNSHDGRESVGRTLASFVQEVQGKLSNIVIGFFPEEHDVNKYDVCSMEANVDVAENGVVSDVEDVSGIAIGSSQIDSPAFAGAKRLATIQCFGEENKKEDENKKGDTEVKFIDVVNAVKEMNIYPHQLFSEEDVKSDMKFRTVFDERDSFKKKFEDSEKNLTKTKEESETAVKESQKNTASNRLKDLIPEGMTDKVKEYVVKEFDPEKTKDLDDEGLKKYIEVAQKEFSKYAKMFGNGESGNSASNEGGSGNTEEKDPTEAAIEELVS